ncbi:MAG: hypothetical protein OXT71_06060 [Acidobacteriota bacterium]|nr:hypothetical protein [Acidobacteriota bacterium]
MTVIFSTNAGTSALAGDMLLSTQVSGADTNLRIPSQPAGIEIPSGLTPQYIPVRMRRKIFVVNDRMAVGVAGPVPRARALVTDMIDEFGGNPDFQRDDISVFLKRHARVSSDPEAVGAIVLAGEEGGVASLAMSSDGPMVHDSKRFGEVVSIGVGAESIIRQVEQLDKYKIGYSRPQDGGKGFPEFVPLSYNLVLLANLYWNEIVVGNNIFDSWGGAYDLIYRDADKTFQYLEEYTIFLRYYDHQQSDQGVQLRNVLKYERRSDVSLLTMLHDDRLVFFGARDTTDPDDPLDVRVGGPDFTMNSKVHVSIIQIGKGRVSVPPMIQIDGLGDGDESKQTVTTLFDEEGRLCVWFEKTHEEWLVQEAKKQYQRYSDRIDQSSRSVRHHWE